MSLGKRFREWAADAVKEIDTLSRQRALSDDETDVLQHLIDIADGRSRNLRLSSGYTRTLARLGIKRDMGAYPYTPHTARPGTSRARLRERLERQ